MVAAARDTEKGAGGAENEEVIEGGNENIEVWSIRSLISCIARSGLRPGHDRVRSVKHHTNDHSEPLIIL
jgi:hypothetical protein